MSELALLAELDAAGVRLSRAGDDLHYRTRHGVSLAPYRDQILANKPALLAALHEREAMRQYVAQGEAGRLTPDQAAAVGLDPMLAWTHVDRGPVSPARRPASWTGLLCDGCRWPELCGLLGPRGPHLPGGPCAAWPETGQLPHCETPRPEGGITGEESIGESHSDGGPAPAPRPGL